MSEVEKMYKTVGIEPKMLCDCEFKNLYDYSIEYGSDVCEYTESNIKNPCKICKLAKQIHPLYPEFTAEKQLEVVKLILFSTWWMNLKRLQFSEKFEEGLAQMLNELWQDLTEQERTAIAEILRG